jgi:Ras GTPase-activating-like protein IQGAP2/3
MLLDSLSIVLLTPYSAPETFDIVPNTIPPVARKNLSEISKMLMQIISGVPFGEGNPCLTPLNSYVLEAIKQMNTWFLEGLPCR